MATERQIAANRANAQRSTGPITPEGKAKSAANAFRDALTAQVSLMPDEDRTAHDAFCDELIADLLRDLTPAPALERQLAQTIAEDNWRLNRMKAVETTIFTVGLSTATLDSQEPEPQTDRPTDPLTAESRTDANGPHTDATGPMGQAQTFAADPKKFQLLTLYIQRTSREIHRDLQLLRELQTERKAAHATALKQAADLLALHCMKNRPPKEKIAQGKRAEGEPVQSAPAQRDETAGLIPTLPAQGSMYKVGELTAGLIPTLPAQGSMYKVNGFVFSPAEIEAAMTRHRHIREADWALKSNYDHYLYRLKGGSLAA